MNAKQLTIFDVLSNVEHEEHLAMREPEVGEYVTTTGAVICHIMRPTYIGKKVLYDVSTQSRTLYQCGILEDYFPHEGGYRSVIYYGKKQRALINHRYGLNIFEPLPWDAYLARNDALKRRNFGFSPQT